MSLCFDFSDEQNMMRDAIQTFCKEEVEPLVEEAEKTESFPLELFPKMAEMGLLGICFDEKYGGLGLDKVTQCILAEELGKTCAGIAKGVAAHVDLGSLPVSKFGTEEQKEKYLKPSIAGEMIGALAITEPNAGSDARAIKTNATKDGDSWILNGTKTWCSNGVICNYVIVAAYTNKEDKKNGISIFIVDKDTPGFEVSRKIHKLGHRSSDVAELVFENCKLPQNALLGEEEGKFQALMETLIAARISHGVKSVGLATAAFEYALNYSKEREAFGRPINKFQAISFKLAQMATKIETARLLGYKAAWLYDQGRPCVKEASMAKLYSAEVVQWCASEGIQVLGGYGYATEYAAERYYRDAKLSSITEGTSEIQHVIIAKELGI